MSELDLPVEPVPFTLPRSPTPSEPSTFSSPLVIYNVVHVYIRAHEEVPVWIDGAYSSLKRANSEARRLAKQWAFGQIVPEGPGADGLYVWTGDHNSRLEMLQAIFVTKIEVTLEAEEDDVSSVEKEDDGTAAEEGIMNGRAETKTTVASNRANNADSYDSSKAESKQRRKKEQLPDFVDEAKQETEGDIIPHWIPDDARPILLAMPPAQRKEAIDAERIHKARCDNVTMLKDQVSGDRYRNKITDGESNDNIRDRKDVEEEHWGVHSKPGRDWS